MPTYSYECKKCGHSFEKFHGMNESPRVKCIACGGAAMKMIGTGAGIIFKGSGFYETDYKKKTGTADAAPAAKTETKDTKPAVTGDTAKTTTESGKKKPEKSVAAKD